MRAFACKKENVVRVGNAQRFSRLCGQIIAVVDDRSPMGHVRSWGRANHAC